VSVTGIHFDRLQRTFFWCAAIVAGFVRIWAHRHDMNPDGISYIELAAAGTRIGWKGFVNAYWSPLYPFLLSLVFRVLHPVPYWESTVVHLVNFVIYLASLACFEVFLKELIRGQSASNVSWNEAMPVPPQTVWTWAGYISFIWAYQYWQNIVFATPDLCVAGIAFLSTAILLRIRASRGSWTVFACLGAILGLAYLAKAAMFPLAFVFLACGFLAVGSPRRALPRTALALSIFLLVATPLLIGLSKAKHRVTFGDSGRIAYAVYIDGVTAGSLWQGDPPGFGTPAHPVRKLLSVPSVYEFAAPIQGSYPPWYDPSYWYEGVKPRILLNRHVTVLFRSAFVYVQMLLKSGALCVVGIALIFLVRKSGGWSSLMRKQWMAWLPACAALGMYMLVFTEPRYVGGFALILLMSFFVGVRLSRFPPERFLRRTALVMILAPAISVLWSAGWLVAEIIAPQPFEQWEVAQGLRGMGIEPGTAVGTIGCGPYIYWAHLAEVRVVAEIPDSDRNLFWRADPGTKAEIMDKFAEAGAQSVVAVSLPATSSTQGWEHIPGTIYYVHAIAASGRRMASVSSRLGKTD
jgi:hypothetical protein